MYSRLAPTEVFSLQQLDAVETLAQLANQQMALYVCVFTMAAKRTRSDFLKNRNLIVNRAAEALNG